MNYIRELNAFYEWLESNPCSTGVVALWFVLMAINNRTGWKREFTVANQTLQAKTGMSRQQLDRCRRFLVEAGRITYTKSNRVNQAGTYSIVKFETQNESQDETQNESRNGHGMSHEITTLFKQNKTKQREVVVADQENVSRLTMTFYQCFHRHPNGVQQKDLLDYMDKGMEVELLILDMEKAARKNKQFDYAEGIMRDQLKGGITTVQQFEIYESQRQIAITGGERSEYPRRSGTSACDSPPARKRIVDTPGAY